MRRIFITCLTVLFVAASSAAQAGWRDRIDKLVGRRSIGVMVSDDGARLYGRDATTRRTPASNEKVLLSMVLLDRLGPGFTFKTQALAYPNQPQPPIVGEPYFGGGVVEGDLWIEGTGDPSISNSYEYGKALSFAPSRIRRLARLIDDAGVTKVNGSVMGATTFFRHDWWAPGWKPDFPNEYIALPSALSINGNIEGEKHISTPEKRAAKALTNRLRKRGIRVVGRPGFGHPPPDLVNVATLESVPLINMLRHMNRYSSNFFAEMFGKRIGRSYEGAPGTIAKGAVALQKWAAANGVRTRPRDGSGLSFENRVSPRGLVRLLQYSEAQPWGDDLRLSLPAAGQGTLENRLHGVVVRAKTGTLTGHSALSGWVWMEGRQSWGEFSILSRGLDKWRAVEIEDAIVRILATRVE